MKSCIWIYRCYVCPNYYHLKLSLNKMDKTLTHFNYIITNHLVDIGWQLGRWICRGKLITWTQVHRLTPLDVKNINYNVTIKNLYTRKLEIRYTMIIITSNLISATWDEVWYNLDVCCAHIKINWNTCSEMKMLSILL